MLFIDRDFSFGKFQKWKDWVFVLRCFSTLVVLLVGIPFKRTNLNFGLTFEKSRKLGHAGVSNEGNIGIPKTGRIAKTVIKDGKCRDSQKGTDRDPRRER